MIVISSHDGHQVKVRVAGIVLPAMTEHAIQTTASSQERIHEHAHAGKCYHCGDKIPAGAKHIARGKSFCCEGCLQVYLLLAENGLCTYYDLDKLAGVKVTTGAPKERFAYLDDAVMAAKLLSFNSPTLARITFQVPSIHCSSCIYLLEHLSKINQGIRSSRTDFIRKEVSLSFDPSRISLRQVAELLSFIGYEPVLQTREDEPEQQKGKQHTAIYKIGVAGFCFANIMMLSFPEYFSGGHIEPAIRQVISILIPLLSLPVLLYSASGIFLSAIKGIRQRTLNIDAPIALAILITFGRSYYELITQTGAGYLDSGSGIVFFMLIGRWFQGRTYQYLSFERDYRSYFPLAVKLVREGKEMVMPVTELAVNDQVRIRHGEMIPADAVLVAGHAMIDYSFVTGEHTPVPAQAGELLFAGGKQTGGLIDIRITKPYSRSYITGLWNNDIAGIQKHARESFIHPVSRYFTLVLFMVAGITAVYWAFHDPALLLPAITAVLIVACPCSLLLSATFTFGNMVHILGKHQCYLKNESVIESLAAVDTLVFDKTGTLTGEGDAGMSYEGLPLSATEHTMLRSVCMQSAHPISMAVAAHLAEDEQTFAVSYFREYPGKGLIATVDGRQVELVAPAFLTPTERFAFQDKHPLVCLRVDGKLKGCFRREHIHYRDGLHAMMQRLGKNYQLHVLSGDHDGERARLREIFGKDVPMFFSQSPQDKLEYVKQLQATGHRVLMAGDGLNDAGALLQADCGIAVNAHSLVFTPASDVILDATKLSSLDRILAFAKEGKQVIVYSFVLSILYNIVGLSFAVSGQLSPVVAAWLMPASSITIVTVASLGARIAGRKLKAIN